MSEEFRRENYCKQDGGGWKEAQENTRLTKFFKLWCVPARGEDKTQLLTLTCAEKLSFSFDSCFFF